MPVFSSKTNNYLLSLTILLIINLLQRKLHVDTFIYVCQQWIENSGASSFLSAKLVISKIIPIKNGYR